MKVVLVLTALFVAGSTVWVVRQQRVRIEALPVYGSLESFQLVDQQGHIFDSASLKGHVSIVNFIFTSCHQVCPLLTRQMARLQEKTKDIGGEVRLLSISVDPNKDTPARLKEYGLKHKADFARWTFLTGPLATIQRVVVKGFMNAMSEKNATAESEPDLFEITHGENFVILDKRGEIRAFRQAKTDRDLQGMVRIVRQLHSETAHESTATPITHPGT